MSNVPQNPTVQIICDLRHYNRDINDAERMQGLWENINNQLIGKMLTKDRAIEIQIESDKIVLWVVENQGIAQVMSDTTFTIVDILRSPRLFYRCQVCQEYGPLRCVECSREKRPEGKERLCTRHAHFIQDRMSAYCPEHKPLCSCTRSCQLPAVFACTRCKNLFGKHYRKSHPHNPDVDYCQNCHHILFDRCSTCQKMGKSSLGRQRCSYKTQAHPEICGDSLCWDHAYQWKIWGPQNRGITFCEKHKQLVSSANPADILFIMLTAYTPLQNGYTPITNIFRVRRLLNRTRTVPLSLEQIGDALRAIAPATEKWEHKAKYQYDSTMKSFNEIIQLQRDLFHQIQDFYRREAGPHYAKLIAAVGIADSFFKPDEGRRHNIDLYLHSDQKGPFVGRGGGLIKSLQAQLKIAHLSFWFYNNGKPRAIE